MSEGEQQWYIGVRGKGLESSDVGSVPLHLVPLASDDPWRETVHDIQKMYRTYQNLRSRTLLCEPTAPPCAAELATGVF